MHKHSGHKRITIERISVTTIRKVERSRRGFCNVCGLEVDLVADPSQLESANNRQIPAIDITAEIKDSDETKK